LRPFDIDGLELHEFDVFVEDLADILNLMRGGAANA
jgi:hypothetical protein